ncbi:MAG: response regulator [Pseudacidovorax sp.]|uniref:response regulator n=1 Tax=Pseudacidovorax sp. TaxID=1934311 RepID=UPI001B468BFE|nr:response regulator [Pseudacidovorax sp.]MBP6897039.1 response regulator [Pseudacidovorax sp.]
MISKSNAQPIKTEGQPDRLVQILKVVVWPAALLLILLVFKGTSVPKDIELNEKGIKISFYLLQAVESGGPDGKPPEAPPNTKAIQDVARKASAISLDKAKVLWVDDNPQNQEYERNALSALGVTFVQARSTSEALPLLQSQQFALVITDFKRVDDERAGYTLLKRVQSLKNPPPLIIYSGSASPEFAAEAKRLGAFAETNQPQQLFSLAVEAIVRPR